MFKKIRSLLIILILLPLVFIFSVFGNILLSYAESKLEAQLQREMGLVVRSLRYPVANAMRERQIDAIESSLYTAVEIRRIFGVYIYSFQGEPIVSIGPLENDDSRNVYAYIQKHPAGVSEYIELNEKVFFSVFEPLRAIDGELMGYIQVISEESLIKDAVNSLRVAGIVVFILIALTILVVVIAGHHFIIEKPLRLILKDIDEHEGDRQKIIEEVPFPLEFKKLSQTLNKMIQRILESQNQVKKNHNEKMELEKKLLVNKKMAAIGEIAAGVAHDLGNPMSIIDITLQRLQRKKDEIEPISQDIESVREEIKKMQVIVRELLDFSGQNKFQDQWCQLLPVIEHVISNYLKGHEVIIEKNIDLREFYIDPIKFEQVFVNIIKNARDAVSKNEVKKIKVEVEKRRDFLVLKVMDNGKVEMIDSKKFTEPFYSEKQTEKGTGLGLAICKNIVEHYQGEISFSKESFHQDNMTVAYLSFKVPSRGEGS